MPVVEYKKLTNAKYKYAVCYIDKHELAMRADAVADIQLCNNVIGLWKEVRALNRNNTSLPCVIESVSGGDNIGERWRQHYSCQE